MSESQTQEHKKGAHTVHRELVYQAIVALFSEGKSATRPRLSDIIDVPPDKLDEHLRMLKDARRIRAIERGVFEPIFEYAPPRVISKTMLPNGYRRVDIGDLVLDLTPEESRQLGLMMYFEALTCSEMQTSRELRQRLTDQDVKIRQLESLVQAKSGRGEKRR